MHALLLWAARFEVARRQRAAGVSVDGPGELDDLAMHAANDAPVAVLSKLDTYRGDSRFTTWGYTFALLEAAVKIGRRAWHGREVPLDPDGWGDLLDDRHVSPDDQAEASELIRAPQAPRAPGAGRARPGPGAVKRGNGSRAGDANGT
jgi:RNA polymerase sigma-70 factor, ECF subfamily